MRSSFLLAIGVALFFALAPCFAAVPEETKSSVLSEPSAKDKVAEEIPLAPPNATAPSPATPEPPTETIQTAPPAPAGPCECHLRPQDQYWVLQTGHLPWVDCQGFCAPNLGVLRFQCETGWANANLAEFLAGSENATTLIYVPGNRVANDEAIRRGWMVYNALVNSADERPIRLVVWSWPSDRVRGLRRDVRTKADRTSTEGMYLGWLLTQIDPGAQVSLLGYSFGARIVCGAMHAARTGALEGVPLPDYVANSERRQARVVLFAAATHNYWILPGYLHGAAVEHVDRMLLFFNPCDPALKRYGVVDKCERPDALGYTGYVSLSYGDDVNQRLRQVNVSCMVGKSHDELLYLGNATIMAESQQYLLWQNVD